jgi:hypothetical protein
MTKKKLYGILAWKEILDMTIVDFVIFYGLVITPP